jgi:outer membrane protein assembly factor BamB
MGQEFWKIEHDLPHTPRWYDKRSTLFVPSNSPAGSAAYSVKADGARDVVKQLWKKPELQIEQCVLVADQVYAAGAIDGKPALFRVTTDTGEVIWRDESFGRGYVIYANGKLMILDRQGNLAIGTESGGSFAVNTRTKIEPKGQWAAPSLDMGRLYLRDHARVLAFNLNATQYPADQKKEKRAPKVERESK